MRKVFQASILAALLAALLCVSAMAAEPTQNGVYNLDVKSSTYTVTPNTASADVSGLTVDGSAITNFYPGAEKFTVTYAGANTTDFHLVLALNDDSGTPTEGNIVYIDQTTASEGVVEFTVYPSELVKGKTYHIYVVGTSLAKTEIASFSYYQSYKAGDCDGVEGIDTNDALAVLNHVVGNAELAGNAKLAADCDGVAGIDTNDALAILNHVVGNITL